MADIGERRLKRIYLRYYLLAGVELNGRVSSSSRNITNKQAFSDDFESGRLRRYSGESVVYCDGIRCGHSTNSNHLYKEAMDEYGRANIAVFRVPEGDAEEPDFERAIGSVE